MNEVRLEYLTSNEISAAIDAGVTTAILPLGAVEQHGPHLPLSMDADHADALAVSIAAMLGGALVLPTVRVGYSPHHLHFRGTLSIRPATLEAVCEDYCRHLAGHGFRRVVIFSGHIGNHPVMQDFESRLANALAPLSVIMFSDTEAILSGWRDTVRRLAGLEAHVGGHGDIAETSVMLCLDDAKVRSDRFVAGFTGTVDQQLLDRVFEHGIDAVSPTGILGNPSGASERIGAACLQTVASLIATYARDRGAGTRESCRKW